MLPAQTVRYRLLCPCLLFNDTPKCRSQESAMLPAQTVRYRLLCPCLLFNGTPKCRNASDAGDIFYDKKAVLKTEIL